VIPGEPPLGGRVVEGFSYHRDGSTELDPDARSRLDSTRASLQIAQEPGVSLGMATGPHFVCSRLCSRT
jgi:hypothetical protein